MLGGSFRRRTKRAAGRTVAGCGAVALASAASPAAGAAGRIHLLRPRHGRAPAVIPGPAINHVGPVQTAPRVYVVFWDWTSDPSGEQAYLTNFLTSVDWTAWLATIRQYGGWHGPRWMEHGRIARRSRPARATRRSRLSPQRRSGISVSGTRSACRSWWPSPPGLHARVRDHVLRLWPSIVVCRHVLEGLGQPRSLFANRRFRVCRRLRHVLLAVYLPRRPAELQE
jgi:hypothetical protein